MATRQVTVTGGLPHMVYVETAVILALTVFDGVLAMSELAIV
jgi:hypothetical protein